MGFRQTANVAGGHATEPFQGSMAFVRAWDALDSRVLRTLGYMTEAYWASEGSHP